MFGMNKKLVISIGLCAVLFIVGLLGFVVIPNAVGQFKPASTVPTSASVSGNGGNAVMAGDYLYFINGHITSGSIKYKQNEYNKVKGEGAIYRVKMANGTPEYDNSYLNYLEDWKGEYDAYDRFSPNQKYAEAMDMRVKKGDISLIVPKIAGWEESALWIFGNTLIYTSPNNQKNKHGQLQRDNVDFFRVDLNGKNHRKIYTTRTDGVYRNDFTVVNVKNQTYLLCRDGNRLVRVNMNGKVSVISTKTDTFALPTVSSYYEDSTASLADSYAGMMGYVFYTETAGEKESIKGNSNIIMAYDIAKDTKSKLRQDEHTHTMMMLGNGTLMFRTDFRNGSTDGVGSSALYLIGNKTEWIDGKRTVVPAIDLTTDNFGAASINANFRLRYETGPSLGDSKLLDSTGEVPYFSGEQTDPNSFSFVTHGSTDKKLILYERVGNNYVANGGAIVNDAEEILEVTSAGILYKTIFGKLVYINYSGDIIQNHPDNGMPNMTNDEYPDTMSVFQVLSNKGMGYMYFYIKTVTHADGEGSDTITIPAIIDGSGREYLLTRLNKKFIPEMTV